jgi:hypothetical protein
MYENQYTTKALTEADHIPGLPGVAVDTLASGLPFDSSVSLPNQHRISTLW